MRLQRVKPNKKDPVVLEYRDGTKLLFSYEVPIAAFVPGEGYLATTVDVSDTARERIASWVDTENVKPVSQDDIFSVITSRRVPTKEDLEG